MRLKISENHGDRFTVTRAILREVSGEIESFEGVLLDIGCGRMPYKQMLLAPPSRVTRYIGLDLENALHYSDVQPDLTWDGRTFPLKPQSIDCAIATEVLEHLPEPGRVLREVHRVLKNRGRFFFTVPFLWPLHDVPNDECRYTPFALERLLKEAGFDSIRLRALGGWDASLAQMLGLWAGRRPMSPRQRRIATILVTPLVKYLTRKDVRPTQFGESTMITGLAGTAIK